MTYLHRSGKTLAIMVGLLAISATTCLLTSVAFPMVVKKITLDTAASIADPDCEWTASFQPDCAGCGEAIASSSPVTIVCAGNSYPGTLCRDSGGDEWFCMAGSLPVDVPANIVIYQPYPGGSYQMTGRVYSDGEFFNFCCTLFQAIANNP